MRKILSTLVIAALALLAAPAQAQVCLGVNSSGRFATCLDATAANLNMNNATAGTLAPGRGGTGLTSFTGAGYLPYASSSSALSMLAAGTNGYFLQMVAGLPAWSQTLGGANGGTGITSFTQGGVFYGATTTTAGTTSTNTAGYLLQLNGTSAPTAVNPNTLSTAGAVLTGQTLWATPVVGQLGYTSANATEAKAIATACSTAVPVCSYQGVSGQCQTTGPMLMFFDSGLTLSAGNTVYVSDVNAGQVTNVAPTTAGHCVVSVGILNTASGYVSGSGSALMVTYQPGLVQQL